MDRTAGEIKPDGKDRFYILVLMLLAGPFYLNDFSSIYLESWRWWLFIDYTAVKLFPLLVALWLMRSNKIRAAELGLRAQALPPFLAVFLVVTLAGTLIDQNGYGLLVGVFEELVFRG